MRGIAIGLMLAAMLPAGTAFAFSDQQMVAMSHVGQASAGPFICPKVEVSLPRVAIVMAMWSLDIKDPVIAGVITSKIRETVDAWKGKDENSACVAIMMLYGPEGANVPDLIHWKN